MLKVFARIVLGLVLAGSPLVLLSAPAAAAPACGSATVTITRQSGPVLYLETGSSPALDSAYVLYRVTNTSGTAYADLWAGLGSFAGPAIGLAPSESGRAHLGALAAGASANAAFYLTASAADASPEAQTVSVYTTRPDLAGAALCSASFTMTAEADISASANKVTSVSSSAAPQLGGRLSVTVVGNTGTIGAAGLFTATPASYQSWPAGAYRLVGATITMSGGNTGTFVDTLFLSGLNSSATDYTAQFVFAVVGTTATATAVSPMTHISSGTQVKHTTTSNFGSLPAIPAVVNNTSLTIAGSPASLPSSGGTGTYTTTVTNAGSAAVTLDDLTATLPAGTTYVPGSATFGGAPVADPALSGSTALFLAGLSVPAGATRTLTLQVTVPGTPGGYTAAVVGHVASVVVDATTGTGDNQPATGTITIAGPPPAVTAIAPATGPAEGGTTVTVTGSGFTGATAVTVGGVNVPGFTVVSDTTVTITTPPGSGAPDIVVTTPSGASPAVPADVFTYAAPLVPAPAPAALTSTGAGTAVQSVTLTVPAGGAATLLDAGAPVPGPVTVAGQGTYARSGSTLTFTPVLGYTGTATAVGYRITDEYQRTGDATYTPTVTAPAGPAAGPLSSTGAGVAVQSVTAPVPAQGTLDLLDAGSPVADLTVAGQGAFHAGAATITFTPVTGFTGPAAVDYRVTDAYGQSATATYTATVTPPPPPAAPDRSTSGIGTDPQNAPLPIPPGGTITLLDAGDNPVTTLTVAGLGTYTLTVGPAVESAALRAQAQTASAGTVTFTPVLGYQGTAPPVRYRITDAYGQSATGTYTPTVTPPPAPPATPKSSTGNQTDPQHTTLSVPAGGTITLLDAGGNPVTTLTIAGQGTYRLDAVTGELSFTPQSGFTGTPDAVTYRVTDAYGQSATATYTPAIVASAATPPAAAPAPLPVTGPAPLGLVATGLLLVLAGALLRLGAPARPA